MGCNSVTVNTNTNTVTVNQETARVVTVNSIGPQGPVGPQGPPGGGGTGGDPGGSGSSVQFNDGGSFSGSTSFTYNKNYDAINLTAQLTSSAIISSSNNIEALQFIGLIDGGGF